MTATSCPSPTHREQTSARGAPDLADATRLICDDLGESDA